jgi:hypothetical protein
MKLLTTLILAAMLAFAGIARAQTVTNIVVTTNTVSLAPVSTPTIEGSISNLFSAINSSQTNWYFGAYYLYASGLEHKNGAGIAGFYPLSDYILAGVRADYVNGGFWMPSGNATFQVPITPIKSFQWLTVTPFAYAGVGIPLSGAVVAGVTLPGQVPKDNNGQATAILGYGASISVWKGTNTTGFHSVEIVGDRETWTGFPGQQYRIGIFGHVTF